MIVGDQTNSTEVAAELLRTTYEGPVGNAAFNAASSSQITKGKVVVHANVDA